MLADKIYAQRDPEKVAGLSRFFKTGPGQYGYGDQFLGIKVPTTRAIVKECWKECSLEELQDCIGSPYHEVRLAALLTLVQIYKHARKDAELQKRCVDFYLANTAHINNWDLVDLSCYEILGDYLLNRDRSLLYELARNGKTIWERRMGIVSTMAFVRKGQTADIYSLADIFLETPKLHDLLQKAVGWMLREAGKRDPDELRSYLEPRHKTMPRTLLRYAIEKIPEAERKAYLE